MNKINDADNNTQIEDDKQSTPKPSRLDTLYRTAASWIQTQYAKVKTKAQTVSFSGVKKAGRKTGHTLSVAALGMSRVTQSGFQTVRQKLRERKTKAQTVSFSGVKKAGRNTGHALSVAALGMSRLTQSGFQTIRQKLRERKIRSKKRIHRTDRERVYKLRGYTTMEKVNRLRKTQRRFRLAQRLLFTLLCIAVIGYLVLHNNPLTDVSELKRMIGLRSEINVEFRQYEFDIVIVEEPDEDEATDEEEETIWVPDPLQEVPNNENFLYKIRNEGRATSLFYIRAFENVREMREVLQECTIRISDEALTQVVQNHRTGTILAMYGREGNYSTYRFTQITESGIMLDLSANVVSESGGSQKIYIIGIQEDTDYSNHSLDVEVDWNPR